MEEQPEPVEGLIEATEVGRPSYDKYFSSIALVSGEYFFDKRTGALIHDAKIFSQLLAPSSSVEELHDRQQVGTTTGYFEHSKLGIHHLLAAFKKQMARDSVARAPHLVLALLREVSSSEVAFLTDRNFKVEKLLMSVCRHHNIFSFSNVQVDAHSTIRFAPESRVILSLAKDKANKLKAASIASSHLALALLKSQRWLREIVEGFTGSSVSTIVRRLEHCSSFQLSESNELNTVTSSSTIELTVSFDNLDNQIEPWSQSKAAPLMSTIEDRLSKRSKIVLEHAIFESKKLHLPSVSVETIMLGLLNETFGPTYQAFSILDLDLTDAHKILTASARRHSGRTHVSRTLSVNALRLMERAWHFAQLLKMNRIDPEHIALAIAEEEHGVASFVCEALAIHGSLLRAEVLTAMNKSKKCIVPF